MTDDQQVLYRMYDDNERLLYVGITNSPATRFSTHRGTQPWWDEVTTIRLERYATRQAVARAETAAIQDEDPIYNQAGRPPMGPRISMKRDETPTRDVPLAHYVGAAEIQRLLDVSRQRVQTVTNRSGFPEPYARLKAGKVWVTDDVREWAAQRGRVLAEW